MQKLFENWREYRKDILNEQFTDVAIGHQEQGYTLDKLKVSAADTQKLASLSRHILSMVDLTGVLSWPELKEAAIKFEKDPSLANAGWYVLAFMAVLPAVGVLAGPAKAVRIAKLADTAGDASRLIRTAKAGTEGAELAAKVEKAAVVAKATANDAAKMSMKALDEAFESGVIGFDKFKIWFKKVKPDASRAEVTEAFNEIKGVVKWAGKTDTDPVEMYMKADHQFFKVMKKYNVEIDPSMKAGGWTDSLADAAPEIWNKYLKKYGLKPGAKIPTAAVGMAVRSGAVEAVGKKAGQKFFHALFHEIGHVELLKRFPTLAKPFLKEYRLLIAKRMENIVKKFKLDAHDFDAAEEIYALWKSHGSEVGIHEWKQILKYEGYYDVGITFADKQKFIAALQYKVLKETEKAINAAEAAGDIGKIMMSGPKQMFYGAFQDVGHISQGLGMKQHKFYFLNFEEVAAELFEKTVRKRMGQHRIPVNARPDLRSERFPETVKIFQKIVDEEIGKLIKESINSYHISTRKLNILIG